jgi:glycosyltransferase involved in cell wall biosynthesis
MTGGYNHACLSVVIPVYNEQDTLASVVQRLLSLACVQEIIIVDDGSSDRTTEIASELAAQYSQITLIRHPVNRGKTEALKTGFARTRGDLVLVQDADCEYDPSDIPALIVPLLEGRAGAVFGSRFLAKRSSHIRYSPHLLANKLLTFLSNLLTGMHLTDLATGYKAFRGSLIRDMIISSRGFGFDFEVPAKLAKLGVAICEVPIRYQARSYAQGKKIRLCDAIAALWYLLRFNLFCSLRSSFRELPPIRSLACSTDSLRSDERRCP